MTGKYFKINHFKMKKFVPLLLIVCMVSFAYEGKAQLSKKEKKEWKKRIKQLSPSQYKSLLDENKALKGQVSSLQTEQQSFESTLADKDDQIEQYQGQVSDLRNELTSTKAEMAKVRQEAASRPAESPGNIDVSKGIVFKVQIGAFKNKDLAKYLEAGDNFSGETDDQGLKQYTLGVFRDYWEADTFKKYLREMGVKDAWIVSFRDGKRVPIKEVLENVGSKS